MKLYKNRLIMIMPAVMLSMMMFGGCGGNKSFAGEHLDNLKKSLAEAQKAQSGTEETPGPQEEPAEAEPEEEPASGVFAKAFQNGEVENNGSFFVRVEDKVYYRLYDHRELERTSLNAVIMEKEVENASELRCCDLNTGEVQSAGKVSANGPIYATTQGFCFRDPVRCGCVLLPMDGSEARSYVPGYPEAVSADGRMLATVDYPEAGGSVSHVICRDGEETARIDEGDDDNLTVFGFAGDRLIAMKTRFSDSLSTVCAYDRTGACTELGELPRDDEFYGYPEFGQMIFDGDRISFTVGWFEGTGHFLSKWGLFNASPSLEGSLQEDTRKIDTDDYVDMIPKIYRDDAGNVEISPHLAGELGLSDLTGGDLVYYDTPSHMVTLRRGYAQDPYNNRYGDFLEESAVFRDKAFVLLAGANRDELADIGWRTAYDLYHLYYECIPFSLKAQGEDGAAKEIKMLDMVISCGWGDGDISVEELTGTWKLYSYDVEGYYGLAEEDGQTEKLIFEADGSARFVREMNGKKEQKLHRVEPEPDSEITLEFETEKESDNPLHFAVLALKDNKLDVSITYYYDGGVPGGYTGYYLKDEEVTE